MNSSGKNHLFDLRYQSMRDEANVSLNKETPKEALKTVRAFYQAYPRTADANNLMARAYVMVKDRVKAIEHAEVAYKINSGDAGNIFILGRLYLDFQLFEFAAPLLRDAYKKSPGSLLINWALADYEMAINDGFKAVEHYEAALSVASSPEHMQGIKIELARALESVGRSTEADAIYSDLQSFSAMTMTALTARASLKLHGVGSPVYEALNQSLSVAALTDDQKSDVLRVLGNIYDHAKQFDGAFKNWFASRQLKSVTNGHKRSADRATVMQTIYTQENLKRYSRFGSTSKKPLFVMGMPRSGTTLTEQIISAHSEVVGIGELGRMHKLATAFNKMTVNEGADQLFKRFAETRGIEEMAKEYLTLLNAIRPEPARYVVDKDPFQFFSMGYIHLCFPSAKFIHCNRHPADSFISAYQNNMNQHHDYAYDQVEYAKTYLVKQDMITHWRSIFPAQIFELKYEALVEDPRGTVEKLLAFLDLDWEEGCLRFFEKKSTVKTFSKGQVRTGVYTSSKERWRNYEKHLGPLFATLQEHNFDYHRDVEDSTKSS